ncbi:glutathione S-transferase family protein [Undibacterium terreum]|uniref:Glutathione S-transferase n=1 Tax=Undibacterium terreum TaxID=1224302 RepID=A0A916XR22_9BURK|nr:glutathione S-transferase [Undibacterium terreum]GGC98078.1 glutathione S-transferase [Undibacterium terreum]
MTDNTIKLYQSPASPNSRRVRMFLAEKGVQVAVIPVDLGAKEQFSDPYRAINPRLQVPALVLEDGTSITEVPAIWRYLELTHPGTPLLGATAKEQGLIAMWERRVELDGFSAVMEAVRNTVPGLKGRALSGPHAYEQIPALAERSLERIKNFYADLNTWLGTSSFVAGEQFSVADITAFITVDFATGGAKLPIPEEHTATKRWYDRIAARPSAKA